MPAPLQLSQPCPQRQQTFLDDAADAVFQQVANVDGDLFSMRHVGCFVHHHGELLGC